MSTRPVQSHMLRKNHTEWTPPACLFIDTESRWTVTEFGERHTLRLWSAWHIVRHDADGKEGRESRGSGESVESLADYVESTVRGIDTEWVFCHNLSFDLGLTRLPEVLGRRDWQAQTQSVNPGSPWLRMSRKSKRLTFVDSFTYLPVSLARIGSIIGYEKPDLPDNDDSQEAWQARCDADVEILGRAVLEFMAWWDAEHIGRWSITGPASGWNAMRHRPDAPRYLIEQEPGDMELERAAIYGGRRETYKVGKIGPGRFVDWDIHGAYPHVAATCLLPRAHAGRFPALTVERFRKLPDNIGVIAEVHVRRAGGHVPVRIGGECWYPRGAVATVLAGPEIRYLIECGAEVSIGRGCLYWLTDKLSGWAKWCMGIVDGTDPHAPPIAAVWAKHMSRAVIGKFAAHTSRVETIGHASSLDWRCENGWNADTRQRYLAIDLGGTAYRVYADGDSDNAFPAVLSYVESYTRVTVDRMLRSFPAGNVLQVDTDGMLVEVTGDADVPAWGREAFGVDLRAKVEAECVEIMGPQHLIVGGDRRLSGVPRDATETTDHTFVGRSWPGLRWQLGEGASEAYTRPAVKTTIRGPYTHRWVFTDGSTAAVTARIEDGQTTVQPWSPETYGRPTADLAERQNPLLCQLARLTRDDLTPAGVTAGS